jgi:D-alanyl-D-alanine dipeptidase
MGAWGGYKNGQIPLSALKQVAPGKYLQPVVADAWLAAVAEAGRHGIKLSCQEAYRPLGVPADQNVTDASKTSTHGFNQWYAWGVYHRGGPLAAQPGYSNHGWGQAVDTTPGRENGQLVAIMKTHGFVYDISSETWHADFVGAPAPAPTVPDATSAQKANWKALQGYLKQYWGYSGALDGIAGKGTWTATQKWLKAKWGYAGAIDGVPGSQTYAAMGRAGCKLK